MLKRLKKRESTGWQRSVKTAAADSRPIVISETSVDDQSFPWQQLQKYTDEYITKKKKLTPEQVEARLIGYIQNSGDKIDVAIAACGHAVRPHVLRNVLALELEPGPGKSISMITHLQAIVAASRVNPEAVSSIEGQRAISMIAALATTNTTSSGQYLQALLNIMLEGVPPSFLVYHHLHKLALKACFDFASEVDQLRDDGNLYQVHTALSWLVKLFGGATSACPENLEPEQLLDMGFPAWRLWVAWLPDTERLRKWENHFTLQQKVSLRGILALEGPDDSGRHKTLAEGMMVGDSQLEVPTPTGSVIHAGEIILETHLILERLLTAVDMVSITGSKYVDLLIHLCISKTVSSKSLDLLELVVDAGNPSIASLLLQIYNPNPGPRSIQLAAMMKILPLLSDDHERLRYALTPLLVSLASEAMDVMQAALQTELRDEKLTDTDTKLQALGTGLKNSWILTSLDQDDQAILQTWPTSEQIQAMRYLLTTASQIPTFQLKLKTVDYFEDRFIKKTIVDEDDRHVIEALISIWKDTCNNQDLEYIAFHIAENHDLEDLFQDQYLALLPSLSPDVLTSLRTIIDQWQTKPDQACVDLTSLLKDKPQSAPYTALRQVLYSIVKQRGRDVLEYTLSTMRAAQWVHFVIDVNIACSLIEVEKPYPPLLVLGLYLWTQKVANYTLTLTKIETDLGGPGPVTRLLVHGGPSFDVTLEFILWTFAIHYKGIHQPLMLAVIGLLSIDGSNCLEIEDMLKMVVNSSKAGMDVCLRLLELHKTMTSTVVEVFVTSWLQDCNMKQLDQDILKALSKFLGINIIGKLHAKDSSVQALETAVDYIEKQYAYLFLEAWRLDNLRSVYKRRNPSGISVMLKELGIEDPSPIDDLMAKLATSFVGVVDVVDDSVIEIQFPLKATPLQQIAMGVGEAQSLIVRLLLADPSKPPAFCIHVNNQIVTTSCSKVHKSWDPSTSKVVPDQHPCYGRPSRLTYQLSRILTRHLHSGFRSIEQIHKLITMALKDLTKSCIACGAPRKTRLQRSATCQPGCSSVFSRASLEIRLAEIRHDAPTMDLLLSMVHYAAASRKMELLPSCPFSTVSLVDTTLRRIPSISKLTHVNDLNVAVRKLGDDAEKLLSWAALSWRGFITSATGKMKIPGMPAGTHQFIVASAAPNLEVDFNANVGSQPTKVLWHGTSMERLFAIMTQGLKICSGTALQSHGAASGSGIYAAVEPSVAWGYCAVPGSGWSGSSFSNFKVLLGLEAAATGSTPSAGVHVFKNPSHLIVRYIFLVPSTATAPLAAHVAPAMLSVYNSLRQGAV